MGVLLPKLQKIMSLRKKHVIYIAIEILSALKYLHSKGWAHRDLKSPNIMISLDGEIKLIDFGLCTDMSNGDQTKLLGSAFWIPPEMINRQPHNISTDIWSFGVCLLELFIRGPPFAHSALLCMFTVALVGLQNLIPPTLSDLCREFLLQCFTMDPVKRPTAEQLLENEWLKQFCVSRAEFVMSTRTIFLSNSINSELNINRII